MRIAHVVTGGVDRSGRERVIPTLLWLIERQARHHNVSVYVLRYHDQPCDYPLLGADIHDLGSPHGLFRQYRALVRALKRDGPFDVIHAQWAIPAGLVASAAGRRLGTPSVVTLNSGEFVALPDIAYGLQRTRRSRVAVWLTVRLTTCLLACSQYQQRLAREHGAHAELVPLGVDTSLFRPSKGTSTGSPRRLIHVASLNPVKDQRTLLEAFAHVVARFPDVHLDVVGEDTMGGTIQELAAHLNLDRHVTFHGFLPSDVVAALYRNAHLFVLSSRHEAACVAVLEAAASGVATVGTSVGYLADWAPERAVVVPPCRPAALADAVVNLLNDDIRRRHIASAAKDWAQHHDADWTAVQIDRVYRELAAKHAATAPQRT